MKLAYNAAVLLLAAGLFLPTARAGDQRPIVAVFDVETGKRVKLLSEIGLGWEDQACQDRTRVLTEWDHEK